MDFGKTLTNPIVLGGGALLGLVLLLSKSPAHAAINNAVNPQIISATTQMNVAALGTQVELAQIDAQLGAARLNADVTKQTHVLEFLANADNNNRMLAVTNIQSQAGIIQTILNDNTMLLIDINQNNTRLAMGQQETQRTQISANASVDVARVQASGIKTAAWANMIGSVAGSATKMLGAVL